MTPPGAAVEGLIKLKHRSLRVFNRGSTQSQDEITRLLELIKSFGCCPDGPYPAARDSEAGRRAPVMYCK